MTTLIPQMFTPNAVLVTTASPLFQHDTWSILPLLDDYFETDIFSNTFGPYEEEHQEPLFSSCNSEETLTAHEHYFVLQFLCSNPQLLYCEENNVLNFIDEGNHFQVRDGHNYQVFTLKELEGCNESIETYKTRSYWFNRLMHFMKKCINGEVGYEEE